METQERQSISEILASKVNAEGAALLLALMRAQRQTEAPNVSEPRIERVPGLTDQLLEQNDRLKQEKQNLEQDLRNIAAVLDARYPNDDPVTPETLLDRVERVALAASNQAATKGWRCPKPGDKLRVVKLPTEGNVDCKVGLEFGVGSLTTFFADNELMFAVSGVNDAGLWFCLPLNCVEPA